MKILKTIILMVMNQHIMVVQSADVHTMKLIMTIKPAQNAGGMPKKKPGVKPESPNRQIMKWETQTFLQGDGFKMAANLTVNDV